MFKVGADLVESPCFRRCFDKADFSMFGVVDRAEGSELGDSWVGAGNNGLADINFAGLVFTESVQRGIDDSGFRRFSMNNGKVGFLNFPALLHFAQERSVLLAAGDKKKARRFAVETADKREEFPRELLPKPVDQGEGSVGPGGVDEPTGRFIDHEEPGIGAKDGGLGHWWFQIGHGPPRVGIPAGFQF